MIRALTLIVIGAASFAAVYVLMPRAGTIIPEPPAPASAAVETVETPAMQPAAAATDAADEAVLQLRPGPQVVPAEPDAPRAVRDVTPATMTAGPRVTGAIAQSEPAAPSTQPRTERLFNPLVVAAGSIKVREREIHLAGIDAPEFDRMCGKGATAWPCGRLARAALRSFIRGRAIECAIPADADKVPDTASCLVGGDDISAWLVAQGWAAASGEALAGLEKKAREAKLGLFGDGRPDVRNTSVAATSD